MKNKTLLVTTSVVLGLGYYFVDGMVIKGLFVVFSYFFLYVLSKILYSKKNNEENTLDDFLLLFCMEVFFGGILVHSFGYWVNDPLALEFVPSLGLSFMVNIVIAVLIWVYNAIEAKIEKNEK